MRLRGAHRSVALLAVAGATASATASACSSSGPAAGTGTHVVVIDLLAVQ